MAKETGRTGMNQNKMDKEVAELCTARINGSTIQVRNHAGGWSYVDPEKPILYGMRVEPQTLEDAALDHAMNLVNGSLSTNLTMQSSFTLGAKWRDKQGEQ